LLISDPAAKHLFFSLYFYNKWEWPMMIMMIDRALFPFYFSTSSISISTCWTFLLPYLYVYMYVSKKWTFVQVNNIMVMLILQKLAVLVIFLVQSFSFSILLFDVLRKKKDVCDKMKKREQKKRTERQQRQRRRIDQSKIRSVVVDVLWTINNSSEKDVTALFLQQIYKKVKERQLGKRTKYASGHWLNLFNCLCCIVAMTRPL